MNNENRNNDVIEILNKKIFKQLYLFYFNVSESFINLSKGNFSETEFIKNIKKYLYICKIDSTPEQRELILNNLKN